MTTREIPIHNPSDPGEFGRHSVRLLVRHPEMDLSFLGKSTGLVPQLNWISGTERRTPAGKLLPGPHATSVWSSSAQLRAPGLVTALESMLSNIEKAAVAIEEINQSGGSASLILDLDGRSNIGDSLSPALLARIAVLGLELGFEVFPNNELG